MLIEKIKIFETGNYSQGNFPSEKVSEIFGKLKNPVKAQFAHTSKWDNPDNIIEIGEFSNFELSDGIISADVSLNEKGESYYKDGIIKGVSVELDNDNIHKIACLPIGVTPAVYGAEFEETGILSFGSEIFSDVEEKKEFQSNEIIEMITNMDVTEENAAVLMDILDSIWEKIDEKEYIERLQKAGYTVQKEFQKVEKTPGEIRAEVIKEFEAKDRGREEFEKLQKEGKITPAMVKAGLTSEFMASLEYNKNDNLEFQDNKINLETFSKILNSMPGIINFEKEKIEIEHKTEEKKGLYSAVRSRMIK